jgi:hypothetical protein
LIWCDKNIFLFFILMVYSFVRQFIYLSRTTANVLAGWSTHIADGVLGEDLTGGTPMAVCQQTLLGCSPLGCFGFSSSRLFLHIVF